jgi:hypothetical protein
MRLSDLGEPAGQDPYKETDQHIADVRVALPTDAEK